MSWLWSVPVTTSQCLGTKLRQPIKSGDRRSTLVTVDITCASAQLPSCHGAAWPTQVGGNATLIFVAQHLKGACASRDRCELSSQENEISKLSSRKKAAKNTGWSCSFNNLGAPKKGDVGGTEAVPVDVSSGAAAHLFQPPGARRSPPLTFRYWARTLWRRDPTSSPWTPFPVSRLGVLQSGATKRDLIVQLFPAYQPANFSQEIDLLVALTLAGACAA